MGRGVGVSGGHGEVELGADQREGVTTATLVKFAAPPGPSGQTCCRPFGEIKSSLSSALMTSVSPYNSLKRTLVTAPEVNMIMRWTLSPSSQCNCRT